MEWNSRNALPRSDGFFLEALTAFDSPSQTFLLQATFGYYIQPFQPSFKTQPKNFLRALRNSEYLRDIIQLTKASVEMTTSLKNCLVFADMPCFYYLMRRKGHVVLVHLQFVLKLTPKKQKTFHNICYCTTYRLRRLIENYHLGYVVLRRFDARLERKMTACHICDTLSQCKNHIFQHLVKCIFKVFFVERYITFGISAIVAQNMRSFICPDSNYGKE